MCRSPLAFTVPPAKTVNPGQGNPHAHVLVVTTIAAGPYLHYSNRTPGSCILHPLNTHVSRDPSLILPPRPSKDALSRLTMMTIAPGCDAVIRWVCLLLLHLLGPSTAYP